MSVAVILLLDLTTFYSFTSLLKVNLLVDLQDLELAVDPVWGICWLQEVFPCFRLRFSVYPHEYFVPSHSNGVIFCCSVTASWLDPEPCQLSLELQLLLIEKK